MKILDFTIRFCIGVAIALLIAIGLKVWGDDAFDPVLTAPLKDIQGATLIATNSTQLVTSSQVSNIVNKAVLNSVNLYDATKEVTWKFVMDDGNLYTIAITNVELKAGN